MSVFPKRASSGDSVIIHNAFHLRNFKEGIYFPILEINIVDPIGKKTSVFSGITPIVKAPKKDELVFAEQNSTSRYKFSPLVVLGKYFSSNDSVEELTGMLSSISAGKHHYHTFAIPQGAIPGRYLVETIHYINGEKFYSKNMEEDFFYVEQLSVDYFENTVTVSNLSAEECPVKYIEYDAASNATLHCRMEILKSKERKEFPSSNTSFIQYNEDRKLIPLFDIHELKPIQNPRLAYTEKPSSVLIFMSNKTEAYELEDLYMKVWQYCDGKQSKKDIIDLTSESVYNELLIEGLILEHPYAI